MLYGSKKEVTLSGTWACLSSKFQMRIKGWPGFKYEATSRYYG